MLIQQSFNSSTRSPHTNKRSLQNTALTMTNSFTLEEINVTSYLSNNHHGPFKNTVLANLYRPCENFKSRVKNYMLNLDRDKHNVVDTEHQMSSVSIPSIQLLGTTLDHD